MKVNEYLDKVKDRVIREFEYRNGKFIQHYALGGEHEMTPQDVVDCLNALATMDCDLQECHSYIEGQKEKVEELKDKLEKCSNSQWYIDLDRLKEQLTDNEDFKNAYYHDLEEAKKELKIYKKALKDLAKTYVKEYCSYYCKSSPCTQCENGDYNFIIDNIIQGAKESIDDE